MDEGLFEAGDLTLDSGQMLHAARLAYATAGTLADDRSNVVLVPSAFAGTYAEMQWLIGPGMAIDTDTWFVVVPTLFGAGASSAPMPSGASTSDPTFPTVSIMDNVRAQHALLVEQFGVEHLHGVVGCSMGAIQALHWATAYPDAVANLAAVCGTSTTSTHCQVFLDGCRGAIELDPAWSDGAYTVPPEDGLRHLGRVWAGWGFSADYYRQQLYTDLGFAEVEDFARGFWEAYFLSRDANNLLSHIRTWRNADIAAAVGAATRQEALGRVTAHTVIMPAETDMYFPPADLEIDADAIGGAKIAPVPGPYGHFSCSGAFAEPASVITSTVRGLLG